MGVVSIDLSNYEDSRNRTIEMWIEQYSEMLFRFAKKFEASLPPGETVEDLVQDTFLRATQNYYRFNSKLGKPSTWLYRMLNNIALNRVRSRDAIRRHDAKSHHDIVKKSTGSKTIRSAIGSGELNYEDEQTLTDKILLVAKDLGQEYREVFVAKFLSCDSDGQVIILAENEQPSYQAVANRLDVPLGTVKSRLFRLRAKLKEIEDELRLMAM